MKSLKIIILLCSSLFGFLKAFTESKRVTFTYVYKCNLYEKLTQPYNPANCVRPANEYCAYTVAVNLGMTTTKATLTAAGGHPLTTLKRCYSEL
jgi:hypothetical protein